MKEEQILNCLKKETLLDEKTIYTYASSRSAIGGAIGSINGLVLLSKMEISCIFIRLI